MLTLLWPVRNVILEEITTTRQPIVIVVIIPIIEQPQIPTMLIQDFRPIVPVVIPLTRDGDPQLSIIIISIHWLVLMQVLPTVAPNVMPVGISTIHQTLVMVVIALIITMPLPITRLQSFRQIAQVVIVKMHGNRLPGIMTIPIFRFTVANIKANGAVVPIAIPMPVTIRYSAVLNVTENQKQIRTIKA